MSALVCYASLNQRPRKMCNCAILDVTVKKILITAFLKNLPFLANKSQYKDSERTRQIARSIGLHLQCFQRLLFLYSETRHNVQLSV